MIASCLIPSYALFLGVNCMTSLNHLPKLVYLSCLQLPWNCIACMLSSILSWPGVFISKQIILVNCNSHKEYCYITQKQYPYLSLFFFFTIAHVFACAYLPVVLHRSNLSPTIVYFNSQHIYFCIGSYSYSSI